MEKSLKLLGFKVKDVTTGFEGVVTSVSFDLYGCVQAIVTPGKSKDGKLGEGYWFDVKRLKVTSKSPVMEQPTFDVVPGGYDKPKVVQMKLK
jgi:hypothetical protein